VESGTSPPPPIQERKDPTMASVLTITTIVSTRRKATRPFHLSDGTEVKVGQWICSAVRGMNLDPANFPQPNEFRGFRFVDPQVLERSLSGTLPIPEAFQKPDPGKVSDFTELSDWQLWGTGRSAWYVVWRRVSQFVANAAHPSIGRWYAGALIKIIVSGFITKWDMKFASPNAMRHVSWRTFIYPIPSTKLTLVPRETEQETASLD
jgi:hypothetical protein